MTGLRHDTVAAYDLDEPIAELEMGDTLSCPMDSGSCSGEVYIEWSGTMVLSPRNTAGELMDPKSAHSNYWKIGCTEGHVLLLPDDHGDDNNDFMQECYTCPPDEGASNNPVYHDDLGRLRRLLSIEPRGNQ